MALPAGEWTVLELTKLLLQALTPIAVFLLGYLVTRSTRRLDEARWAKQKVVEERIKVYGEVAQKLNDIYCYFSFIGPWKDFSPVDMVARKRDCDRIMHTTRAFFSTQTVEAYQAFIRTCFSEYAGADQDARLRARLMSPLGDRRRAWKAAKGKTWPTDWDDRFVPADKAVSDEEVRSAYDRLLKAFHEELIIWELTRPQAETGASSPGKR
ncbi:MAG: hypothetical protein JWQ37_1285 [Blastococcus sp.]|nr:hypothetical protein [Blastococcus sp.]